MCLVPVSTTISIDWDGFVVTTLPAIAFKTPLFILVGIDIFLVSVPFSSKFSAINWIGTKGAAGGNEAVFEVELEPPLSPNVLSPIPW